MRAEQVLEKYLLAHPDYWEYEREAKEVKRLKSLIHMQKTLNQMQTTCEMAV